MTDTTMTRSPLVAVAQRDRRRAGRVEVKAALLPLLRNQNGPGLVIEHDARDIPREVQVVARREEFAYTSASAAGDDLASARGIIMSAGASIMLWGAIFAAGDMLWRFL